MRKFSDRQREYAAQWRSDTVYTPGFVLNGKDWQWSAKKQAPVSVGLNAGVLTATSSDTNHWLATFAPIEHAAKKFEVHAALLACGLTSDVKAGENEGRRLNHDFTVLEVKKAALVGHGDALTGEFTLASKRSVPGARLALALWVTEAGHLEPLQAAGCWLMAPLVSL